MTHRPVLRAATYLHDIGYAEPLRQSGFHPLDGARFLQEQGWPALVVGLVAHHSGARFVADVRGLSAELLEFDDQRFLSGPLADAVTYADQITGPERRAVDVETRMTEMLRQHGPDSPNARCHSVRTPSGPAPPLVRVPVSYTTFPGERIASRVSGSPPRAAGSSRTTPRSPATTGAATSPRGRSRTSSPPNYARPSGRCADHENPNGRSRPHGTGVVGPLRSLRVAAEALAHR